MLHTWVTIIAAVESAGDTCCARVADLEGSLAEHKAIVDAISRRDEDAAYKALRDHISVAFVTRLKLDSHKID